MSDQERFQYFSLSHRSIAYIRILWIVFSYPLFSNTYMSLSEYVCLIVFPLLSLFHMTLSERNDSFNLFFLSIVFPLIQAKIKRIAELS
jgi:hypothetical protein